MAYRVLLPDGLDPEAKHRLVESGMEILEPAEKSRESVLSSVGDADAMIIRSATTADRELLEKGGKLKLIVRAGVGVDNIDLKASTALGIVVENTPGSNTVSTAELTIALMLSCARFLPRAHNSLAAGLWERKLFTGTELYGKTLGIIGYGRVGKAVAARAAAFGMKILAYDPLVEVGSLLPEELTQVVSLDQLLSQADFITLHTTLTPQTDGLINAKTLAKMKDGVTIINAARGALLDVTAVAEALANGKVAALAVDVYEVEPPPSDYPLIGLENVIHTPHLGASTKDAQKAVGMDAATQVIAALIEGRHENVINPEVFS